MPVAGTLKNFTVRLDAALSGGTSIAYTVRKNGVATTLTCTITTASAALTCSDVTHTVAFVAGDLSRSGLPAPATSPHRARAGRRSISEPLAQHLDQSGS